MKKKIITTIITLGAISAANAGSGKQVMPVDPEPVCEAPFTGAVSIGYNSDYVFRGFNLGSNVITADIDVDIPLSSGLNFAFGANYLNVTDDIPSFDRLTLSGFGEFQVGAFDVAIGVNFYEYIEAQTFLEENLEAGIKIGTDIGDLFYLQASYFHDFEFEGNYYELGAYRTIALTDCLDLNLAAGIGYGDNYDFNESAAFGDHVFVRTGLTYHLTDSASLNAYIAGKFLYDDSEEVPFTSEEEVYGGASLTVKF